MGIKFITIEGAQIPNPDGYEVEVTDIHDTGRNVLGQIIGSPIRTNIEKITLSWSWLTVDAWAEILAKFADNTINYSVSYYSARTAGITTKTMIVRERRNGLYFKDPRTKLPKYWKNCSLTFEEV